MTLNTMSTLGKRKPTDYIGAWLLPDITGEQWRENAACQKFPPQLWDQSAGDTVEDRKRWAQAEEVCRSCPVIAECAATISPLDAGMVRAGQMVSGKGVLTRLYLSTPRMRGLHTDKELAPCGSESAKKRHSRKKESCDLCWPGGKPAFRRLAACDTREARARHFRRKESCAVCNYTFKATA